MRCFVSVLLLCCGLLAEENSSLPYATHVPGGSFYVNGLAYQYVAGTDYTVVAAAHSVMNHKYLGLKLRVLNAGKEAVTFRPEDVVVVDASDGRVLATIAPNSMLRRMERPYNWARYGVNPGVNTAAPEWMTVEQMMNPQSAMMRSMHGKPDGFAAAPQFVPASTAPGAETSDAYLGVTPNLAVCGPVCLLLRRESAAPDLLSQLQRQVSPENVEHDALLANTVLPRADVSGVLYYPLPKAAPVEGKKLRAVRITVPVGGESFQFAFNVE